ncbi:TetR/AcrR family transcriptional regulator [Streptomyces sp. NPDC046182]|uniref:TetR/AcrR family transcriptional regulator n=1 Tax=Streptomyces sp. NPDC046182 TaxID=3154601 RepID=UPI0033E14AD9
MKETPGSNAKQAGLAPEPALGTRERIVRAASLLMQRRGYDGTGIKQIAQAADATLGSVYHFFPGGKQELATAAIDHGNREFVEALSSTFENADDPAQAIAAFTGFLAERLAESNWVDGCPISTTALGSVGRLPDVQSAAAQAFALWREVVSDALVKAGIPEADAHDLAHTVISTLEGAELAAQVSGSSAPLEIAGRHLAQLITAYR